jgi:hypothetical protein
VVCAEAGDDDKNVPANIVLLAMPKPIALFMM